MSALQSINGLLSSLKSKFTREETKDDSKEVSIDGPNTDNTCRITPEILNQCIDLREYRNKAKYPYINILPTTKPSNEFIQFDKEMVKGKQDFIEAYKYSNKPLFTNVDELLNISKPFIMNNDINNKNCCKCIEYKEIPNIKCYWIEYQGANIANGVILVFHGAAYVIPEANWVFAECELLSKLTGMVCIAVEYKKAPKYPLPTPINDAISVYNHFLNELKISSTNIVLVGDSSGGGLVLLTLQQLVRNKTKLPSCAILQSPWCYLNYDAKDVDNIDKLNKKRLNYKYDAWVSYEETNIFAKMALGLMDRNLNKVKNKLIKIMDDSTIYNPIYNSFNGLCDLPMYFMVGATEALLYDSIDCCGKAYNDGCKNNIRLDIDMFMCHSWIVFAGKFPEADYTIVKMADFILKNVCAFEDIPKSEYEPDPGQELLDTELYQIMNKWRILPPHGSGNAGHNGIIQISNSIWYCPSNDGRPKMVRYCLETDQVKEIIKFPEEFKIIQPCCCLFNDMIYIIHGWTNKGEIIEFDPKSHSFNRKTYIDAIAGGPSCVVIYDTIHIFGHQKGDEYRDGKYKVKHIIYSPNNNTVQNIKDTISENRLNDVGVIFYKNRLYRFGGYDYDVGKRIDMFAVSNIIEKDQYKNIKWTIKETQKLPIPVQLWGGYVLYKNIILTFGGRTITKNDKNTDIDNIFLYNIDDGDDAKWKEIKNIKCPHKSKYGAILVNNMKNSKYNSLISGYIRQIIKNNLLSPMNIVQLINSFYSFDKEIHLCQADDYGEPNRHWVISVDELLSQID